MEGAVLHRLMVVDDSNVIRRRIERAQDLAVQFVGAARNGREALEMHAALKPTLITMDLTMPEMDGTECVAKLIERDPELLILVVSALADKLTAIEALERGARGFLCKPFTDRQLNDALQMLINTKEARS